MAKQKDRMESAHTMVPGNIKILHFPNGGVLLHRVQHNFLVGDPSLVHGVPARSWPYCGFAAREPPCCCLAQDESRVTVVRYPTNQGFSGAHQVPGGVSTTPGVTSNVPPSEIGGFVGSTRTGAPSGPALNVQTQLPRER